MYLNILKYITFLLNLRVSREIIGDIKVMTIGVLYGSVISVVVSSGECDIGHPVAD